MRTRNNNTSSEFFISSFAFHLSLALVVNVFYVRFVSIHLYTATHASPSATYAHAPDRFWEANVDVLNSNCDDKEIDDIAEQMVYGETGQQMQVIFAGGRRNFLNETVLDEDGKPGRRTDGKNLIQEWLQHGKDGEHRQYVHNKVSLIECESLINKKSNVIH